MRPTPVAATSGGRSVSSDLPAYRLEPNRLKDARCPQFCRAQGARCRAPVIATLDKIGSPAPRCAAPLEGASLTRSGPSRCAPSVFTTDGGNDDHALRPHSGIAGRAAGLPFHKARTRRGRGSRDPLMSVFCSAATQTPTSAANRDRRTTTHRDTPIADGDLSGAEEIAVTDPGHPLYGRRFRLLTVTSGVRSAQLARVVYRPGIFLLLPISVTSLHPPATRSVPTKLCLEALEDLLRVTAEGEEECRSTPTTSGEACRPACAGQSRMTSPPCSGR